MRSLMAGLISFSFFQYVENPIARSRVRRFLGSCAPLPANP